MNCDTDRLKDIISAIASSIRTDAHGRPTFPSGRSPGLALDWALESASRINAISAIAGFWCFENPGAAMLGQIAERHDFLLVEDRYLVDGWLCHVAGAEVPTVLDLEDPEESQSALATYGIADLWEVSPKRNSSTVANTQQLPEFWP